MSDSLESWRGGEAGGARGADILDLDRYVRGGRIDPATLHPHRAQQLVVDGGGVGRLPAPHESSPSLTSARSERSKCPHERPKRFSHDSGVSDESYRHRRPRHRSARHGRATGEVTTSRAATATRSRRDPSRSLTAFRDQCKLFLRQQQEQFVKVAQFCEGISAQHALPLRTDLVVQRAETTLNRGGGGVGGGGGEREVTPPPDPLSDTSDLSSSSHDTPEQRRRAKGKHRTNDLKTYKIIMTKLDEINRLFLARTLAERQLGRAVPRRVLRRSPSVRVSDKIVATDPPPPPPPLPRAHNLQGAAMRSQLEPGLAGDSTGKCALRNVQPPSSSRDHGDTTMLPGEYDDRGENFKANEDWGPTDFDLDNPVQLYVQAKRLQSLREECRPRSGESRVRPRAAPSPLAPNTSGAERESLCAVVGRYWRALRQCITTHFCPDFT